MSQLFIIELNYTVPLEQIDAHMGEHMRFLKKYYAKNIFLASGRKVPRTGGIILALGSDLKTIEQIISEDPFFNKKLAQFKITEFQASQTHPTMKILLDGLGS